MPLQPHSAGLPVHVSRKRVQGNVMSEAPPKGLSAVILKSSPIALFPTKITALSHLERGHTSENYFSHPILAEMVEGGGAGLISI